MVITTEYERNKNGSIKITQKLKCKCDRCGEIFYRTYRDCFKSKNPGAYCRTCSASVRILEYNNSDANKRTLEEKVGKERANEIKKKSSELTSYRRRYGDLKDSTWTNYNKKQKGKSWEERYGKEKAELIKQKESAANSGKNNPMFGKPAPQGSGNGWSGWYNGLYFRSLLELSFIVNNGNIKGAECISIPYIDYKGRQRTYHPDFYTDKCIIEIKPKKLLKALNNVKKFEAANKYCENNGLEFKILTEENINKLTYEEIKQLHDNKEIVFLDKYKKKFEEV